MKTQQGRVGARAIDQFPEIEGEHGQLVVQHSYTGKRRLQRRVGCRKYWGGHIADADHESIGSIVVK